LKSDIWPGIRQGIDAYPTKNGVFYLIGGDSSSKFKSRAIEIYGIKI